MTEDQLPYRQRLNLIRNGMAKKTTGPKPKKAIARESEKKKLEKAAEKERLGGDDTDLVKFYKNAMKRMTGYCIRCGEKHDIKTYAYAISSIAHVLAKNENKFPSVKYHPLNWIELGATCGCHNWYDNFASWEEIALDKIWHTILQKFIMLEPNISLEEKKRLPEVLLQEIKPPF